MLRVAQSKRHAANHPDIDLSTDIEAPVFVNHFRWSIHHSCVFLVGLEDLIYLILILPCVLQSGSASGSEIA